MDVGPSAVGIGLAATTGVGFVQSTTSVSQTDYPDVSAAIVARLNEHPRERLGRVGQFAQLMERERLKREGGRECPSCGVLFVPSRGQPWGEKGYCSKVCLVKGEGGAAAGASGGVSGSEPARSRLIEVECVAGHRFDVQKSFSGTVRRCPVCGEKTAVP